MPSASDGSERLADIDLPESYCRVFLSDNDGHVIRDFGELLPCSNESMSAYSLIGLVESSRFVDFLEAVGTHGDTPKSELKIHLAGSARSLLFRGSQTPYGILVFATSDPDSTTSGQHRSAASATVSESATTSEDDTSNFLIDAVHDLKNPISSIISSCEYLTEYSRENLDPVQWEMISGIEASAKVLLQLSSAIFQRCKPKWRLSTSDAGTTGAATTDSKQTQEQVLATQKLESLGVLASGIAHDFNNMLGGILAQSELALSEIPTGSPVAEAVSRINAVALRAAEIVRQLLAYAGNEGASLDAVDLSGLVRDMITLLGVSISKTSELKIDLAENLPAVRANASQMQRIVMNLITNASEALPKEGGVITVRTARVCGGLRSVAESDTDPANRDYVLLEVRDTGCGMSEEIQHRIFDPFFTTKFAGRGLGLAAVQGIVRSHGGTINVVSAPGQGTSIEVVLPAASERAGDDHHSSVPNFADNDDTTHGVVLLVEDEEALRLATSKMLCKIGFSVLEASSGSAAVDLFRTNESGIDVVLLDLTLPGMGGKDVLGEVRRIRPDVKVILTTAYSEEMAVNVFGGQHDWAFIRKPYRIVDLVKRLREMLRA